MNRIHIVLGVLKNDNGEYLVAKRLPDTVGANKWEFPGGKVEEGETAESALKRELHEEIGINVIACNFMGVVDYEYPDRPLRMELWDITEYEGEPHGNEGQPIAWHSKESILNELDSLPATDVIIRQYL